jgi:hypothetical protein
VLVRWYARLSTTRLRLPKSSTNFLATLSTVKMQPWRRAIVRASCFWRVVPLISALGADCRSCRTEPRGPQTGCRRRVAEQPSAGQSPCCINQSSSDSQLHDQSYALEYSPIGGLAMLAFTMRQRRSSLPTCGLIQIFHPARTSSQRTRKRRKARTVSMLPSII